MIRRTVGIAVEIIHETIGDIRVLKGRGVLALIGIAIGTAAVIAMLHVGHNARKAALTQFETLGTDLMMMRFCRKLFTGRLSFPIMVNFKGSHCPKDVI